MISTNLSIDVFIILNLSTFCFYCNEPVFPFGMPEANTVAVAEGN